MIVVAACLAVIALCCYATFRPRDGRPRIDPEAYRIQWVCEGCGHTFVEQPAAGVRPCPQCGKTAAVQSRLYVCGKCGAEFEGWRVKDYYGADDATDEQGRPVLPVTYFKRPGGEWTTDATALGPLTCPKCGNADEATLKQKAGGGAASQ